jgi:ribosomal protein S11
MMARNRRYGRNRKAAVAGIATAALLGGGGIATAVALAGSHSTPIAAAPAARTSWYGNEGTMLSTALGDWGSSHQGTYSQLSQMTTMRGFSQASHRGKTLAVQRGIVVLATNQFIILQSNNGSLHLWAVSGATRFQNVSNSTSGTAALTANTSATQQAMQSGNMVPAATLLAGSPTTAAAMLTPTPATQTVTVQVAGTDLTVTVTVTRSTATVSQTATTPATNTMPTPMMSTWTMNAWQPANALARGDLAVIVGSRSHGLLHAQLVLFTPLSTSTVGGKAGMTVRGTAGTTGMTGTTGTGTTGTGTGNTTPVHW